MTGKQATKKLLSHLNKKVKFEGISTQKELADNLGISHMTVWDRLQNKSWTDVERVGLGQIYGLNTLTISNGLLTQYVKRKMEENACKKKESIITRKIVAKKLGLPISTFYFRLHNHNWKETEINIIKKL